MFPDNFDLAHDADNEVLEEQAPVMRQRPQKHEAPKKDMEKMKQMEKHFLSESSSEESDEITIIRPTKQRTLSVSCSDDSFPTKLTAKRQRPLPPPLPKRRKKPVSNNKSGEVVENQKKQKSGPVEEARTGVNDADTASTVSNDVLQQAMEESGVSEMGMEPSGEGEVRVEAFNDSHAEEGVVETEHANGVENMPANGEEKEGGVLSLLNDPIVCVDNKQRRVVEKINVALDNTFHMLVALNNREAVAMEVGRLLRTGFQAAVEDARIEGFPPEEGFGPMLIDLFRIYSTYFFIPPLPNHCLAGCKKDGIVEELADAAAIEAHVMTSSHLSMIRRKMIHEGKFLDKKAKLFKISVQKLEEAQDIMSEMTFAPAVGLADQLIEQFQLSIVTILNIIGILFQKPGRNRCSKFDDVFPSHLYDAHLLTPKHFRLTRSSNVINLEAGEENQAEGEDPTTLPPMTGMKKEEVMDPGYGNPHPTIDVVDLTADEEEVTAGLEFMDSVTF